MDGVYIKLLLNNNNNSSEKKLGKWLGVGGPPWELEAPIR